MLASAAINSGVSVRLSARSSSTIRVVGTAVCLFWIVAPTIARGAGYQLSEPYPDQRIISSQLSVSTRGQVFTSQIGGKKDELQLDAAAEFDFRSRRLPPAGRDAAALRSIREFAVGKVQTTVGGRETSVELPQHHAVIVANGTREGVECYAISGAMTREVTDLLEMPGDPLALLALLPLEPIEIGAEWHPPEWAVQMLTGIEAIETSEFTCRLEEGNRAGVRVSLTGQVKGQRFGANTTIDVVGAFIYDLRTKLLSQARTIYTISSDIGTVNPGLDVTVTANLTRSVSNETGRLDDSVVNSVPLEATPEDLKLRFDAPPWGVELVHDRNWHLFQAAFEGTVQVAILRLVELGSLISQCNVSPLPQAAPGQHVPLEQFEDDIQKSLGKRFKKTLSRDRVAVDDERLVYRIVVEGEVELAGDKGAARIPMRWIYYLVADAHGRQASFVFSVEPSLWEQLAGRDEEIVRSLRFVSVRPENK